MFKSKYKVIYVIAIQLLCSSILLSENYYKVSLTELAFDDESKSVNDFWMYPRTNFLLPYVIGDNGEEIYPVSIEPNEDNQLEIITFLMIKTDSDKNPSGVLVYSEYNSVNYVKFSVDTEPGDPAALKDEFEKAKRNYFLLLCESEYPGSAYFRHLARIASNELPERRFNRGTDLDQMMSMFSGSRAVSENIQLDRELRIAGIDNTYDVDLNSIEGITVQEYNWQALTVDIELKEDKLLKIVPFDQYAILFKDFDSMVKAIDYADDNFSQFKGIIEGRSLNAQTLDRYQKQLCLPLDEFSKMIGRRLVKSVVFTGSDPYLRTGSDVAVIFESSQQQALYELIAQYHTAASNLQVLSSLTSGAINGVMFKGVEAKDRSVCSYAAIVGDSVVVTNSKYQLSQIIRAARGNCKSINSLDEYKYFRNRYDNMAGQQKAFLIVTDAAIRKWCGPKWRIAAARRTMAMAKVAELQAIYFDSSMKKETFDYQLDESLGDIDIVDNMVVSETFGSLQFQIPIAEMAIDKVSKQEQQAYIQFRDAYQRRWANFFDPIAASLSISDEGVDFDMTVMPLILNSEYREFAAVTSPGSLSADSGVMNDQTIFEITVSLNKQSPFFQMFKGQTTGMLAGSGVEGITPGYDPFSWLGDWVSINIQNDDVWSEIAEQAANEKTSFFRLLEKRLSSGDTGLPVSLLFDVENKMSANMFIVALRGFMESVSAFAILSEPKFYNNQKYIQLTMHTGDQDDEKFIVYYAISDDVLIFTLSENIVTELLDGRLRNKEKKNNFYEDSNVAVRVGAEVISLLQTNEDIKKQMYNECWRNLPILNYYRNEFDIKDPVAVHEKYWGELLECPAGGEYVWDDKCHTFVSTLLGHPGNIKETGRLFDFDNIKSFNSSIKFDNDGVRVKVNVDNYQN